ncbi:MAG: pyruvate dehydrogenase complex dihydrolipoamide acetyltransferase [Alphaproteobacteria bacterium]
MPIEILMPALSPTMTEGTLAKWLKSVGDEVSSGDVIAEIETDKATMEVEAIDDGVLGKILVDEGTEGVAVNTPIAVVLEEGEDPSALAGFETAAPQPASAPAAEAVPAPAPAAPTPAAAPAAPAAPAQPIAPTPSPAPVSPPSDGDGRIFASPLARRMAQEAGIDLAQVKGTGPHGRVVRADIEAFQVAAPAVAAPALAPAPVARAPATEIPMVGEPEFELVPHTTMRKIIARRLTEAKQTVPHFYVTMDCEIDRLLEIRKELNDRADGAYKLSVNDFVIRTAALALRQVPAANASWSEEGTKRYLRADISVAVAIEGGLVTPVIRAADAKGLREISQEMKELSGRAREGKLLPEEYQGGTFSVSNLGMFGVREFGAIINPPQGCILAVGAGEKRSVVKDGALAIATVMSCTVSVDHRVVDGAVGAEFLAAFKKLIEDPLAMLL